MKLIDFITDKNLNNHRNKMGAPLITWDGFSIWNSFDPFGFRASLNDKGEVDIPFSEIQISDDQTLELFARKILVYIRDQTTKYNSGYRFHISNCSTLKDAQKNNKYDKYVASVNTTNIFNVNVKHSNGTIEEGKKVKMKVCKNCLSELNYEDYKNVEYFEKGQIFNNFLLEDYFNKYQNQSVLSPKYNSVTAPLNDYTKDFKEIANKLKTKHNYTCCNCKIDLNDYKKFLHVHHIDGMKMNNRSSNLDVLCIDCHSKQPGHSHMKILPDYLEFQDVKKSILNN